MTGAIAAVAVGIAIGAVGTAGHALLLETGQGFLRAAGFLIALSLASFAAGLWAGGADDGRRPGRARWTWAVVAFGVASIVATVWDATPRLRTSPSAGALAVLLLLAQPGYVSGMALATIRPRRGTGSVSPLAFLGTAVGVLAAATLLIPRLDAGSIYLTGAALVAGAATVRAGWSRASNERGTDMRGRVAIITGVGDAGQAGFVIAKRFIEAGARVLITARDEAVHERAKQLGAADTVAAVAADLTVAADIEAILDAVRQRFGRLDALINVAGGLSVVKPIADTTVDEWRRETQRNAETAFAMCRAALPLLRETRGGIVNFAAPAGIRAVREMGAYSAGKAAVVALTRALALEERANGVRVNAIAPGMIDTAQNREEVADPQKTKWVTREDIAELALFLASPASGAVSGETVHALGEGLR